MKSIHHVDFILHCGAVKQPTHQSKSIDDDSINFLYIFDTPLQMIYALNTDFDTHISLT